ncbi:type II secretion system F family protein [Patescibacteria group bacterium]|nr:type II secretion system F family protein [Patescibacteria group bacterium]
MKNFKYSSVTPDGSRQQGEITAPNKEQAVNQLRKKELVVTDIAEKRQLSLSVYLHNAQKVSTIDIVIFTRQLAVMLDAGIPIVQALRALGEQVHTDYFAEVIHSIAEEVESGSSLHKAMLRQENVFKELYLSLVNAGEKSGNLVAVLRRLAETLQRENTFKSKVKGAMIYPLVIICVMLAVIVLMFVFVIPQLQTLYDELGADLPTTTKVLLAVSDATVSYWWLFLIIIMVGMFFLRRAINTEQGQEAKSKVILKLPIFGMLTKQMELTSFTRTLSMLISSGLPILDALDISKKTMNNRVFQNGVDTAAQAVEQGGSLGEEIYRNKNFPSMLAEMVRVGEQTGKLDDVLNDLAQYFESEALRTVDNLSSLLEPVVMVILGVGVGFLVISLILPIYSLTSQF